MDLRGLLDKNLDSLRPDFKEESSAMDEDDLREELKRSRDNGLLGELEEQMILSVLDLDDTTVKEILVPQPDVDSIPASMNVIEVSEHVSNRAYTRYPIVNEDQDQVVGYIDVKDIISMRNQDTAEVTAKDIARDLPIYPETTKVDELLVSLQEDNKQIAAVIDEWGSLEGIVTIEDIVEVIVGEIVDEFDDPTQEPKIQLTGDYYEVDGHVPIRRFNSVLGTDFHVSDGSETIAGLILSETGAIPETGDTVEIENVQFKILDVANNRISKIRVQKLAG